MGRVEALEAKLKESGAGGIVVSKIENVRYLTGFTGSSAFSVITDDTRALVTDGRYEYQAAMECDGWDVRVYSTSLFELLGSLLKGVEKVAFESSVSYGFHRRLDTALSEGQELVETPSMIEAHRARKDPGEVLLIEASIRCAASAFEHVLPMIAPGANERDVAAELDYRMVKAGADMMAFDTVVASGPNSALPHAGITDRVIEEGDLVVVDFGARKDGYNCDITRTVVAGVTLERQRLIIEAVNDAVDTAVEGILPGVDARAVDALARGPLRERGLGEHFSHGTGHGVGLEVHELPTLSRLSTDILEPMMVFTIEPGVYIEGWGGVRVEEMVLLEEAGPRIMTSTIGR